MSHKLVMLFSELEVKLAELKDCEIGFHQEIKSAIKLTEEYLFLIQEKLADHIFQSPKAEIDYFKYEYPKIFRLYYFYHTIFSIEKEKNSNFISLSDEKNFYSNYAQNIQFFCKDELNVLREYQLYSLDNEKKLFLRKHYRWRRCNITGSINDTYITNAYSTALGKRDALRDVMKYIERRIEKPGKFQIEYNYNFNWTDNKCDLVELAYALYTKESINNGKIELVNLIRFFEKSFNVQLNNHHTTIQEIKQRKKERTKYIDNLKTRLDQKLLD